jgi:hypothetical protein
MKNIYNESHFQTNIIVGDHGIAIEEGRRKYQIKMAKSEFLRYDHERETQIEMPVGIINLLLRLGYDLITSVSEWLLRVCTFNCSLT